MKYTLDAFGQPVEIEWISEDGRVLSSRTKCFEMHSFPYLEKWDTSVLGRSAPVRLAWKWIQHPLYGDQINRPEKPPVEKVDVICFEYEVPPMTADEALLELEKMGLTGATTGAPFERNDWSAAAAGMLLVELVKGSVEFFPENSPNDLCWRILSKEPREGASGVFVVEATLGDGTVIFLRGESQRERLVPSAAQQYLLAQDQITSTTAVQLNPQQSSLAGSLDDLLALSKDERLAFAGVLARIGFNERYARAMAEFAMGMTAKAAADLAKISVEHFFRLKRRIPANYQGLLSGSNKTRRERAIRHTAAKLASVKEQFAKHVAAMRETRSAATAGGAQQDDADNAFLPEYYAGTPPTPVRGG